MIKEHSMTEPNKAAERTVMFPEGNEFCYTCNGEFYECIPAGIIFTIMSDVDPYKLFAAGHGTLFTLDPGAIGYIDGYARGQARAEAATAPLREALELIVDKSLDCCGEPDGSTYEELQALVKRMVGIAEEVLKA
jgi:hypothetical protein